MSGTETKIALALMQLVALSIPPIAVLIQHLRQSENLPWITRKISFGMVILSVLSFIATGATVVAYFAQSEALPNLIQAGMVLTIIGLTPFALFTLVLYQEHRAAHGP